MYFPYVYGRRHELLALRSANSKYLTPELVVPIIEPVKSNSGDLIRCLDILGKENKAAIVIANPTQGDFKDKVPDDWKEALRTCFEKYSSLIPGVLLHSGARSPKLANVEKYAAKYGGRGVALLYRNSALPQAENISLMAIKNIAYHIVLQKKISDSHLKILPPTKLVHVVDGFNKQPRNADYGSTELFLDSHKTFREHGVGFGDYTVIGEPFNVGGGRPGAVAMHITYRDLKKDEIWVYHFISDETDRDLGTVEGKYLEALGKFKNTYLKRPIEIGHNPAIQEYLDDHASDHFPGLGKNKERQVLHHIARIHDLLLAGI